MVWTFNSDHFKNKECTGWTTSTSFTRQSHQILNSALWRIRTTSRNLRPMAPLGVATRLPVSPTTHKFLVRYTGLEPCKDLAIHSSLSVDCVFTNFTNTALCSALWRTRTPKVTRTDVPAAKALLRWPARPLTRLCLLNFTNSAKCFSAQCRIRTTTRGLLPRAPFG